MTKNDLKNKNWCGFLFIAEASNINDHCIRMYSFPTTETLYATPQADKHFLKPQVNKLQNKANKVVIYALVMFD